MDGAAETREAAVVAGAREAVGSVAESEQAVAARASKAIKPIVRRTGRA